MMETTVTPKEQFAGALLRKLQPSTLLAKLYGPLVTKAVDEDDAECDELDLTSEDPGPDQLPEPKLVPLR